MGLRHWTWSWLKWISAASLGTPSVGAQLAGTGFYPAQFCAVWAGDSRHFLGAETIGKVQSNGQRDRTGRAASPIWAQ
jgi:hypothetical protein